MPVSSRHPREPLLDLAQAAMLLGVEQPTVARWAEAGRLNPVDTRAGHRRFEQGDILRLMVDIKRLQKSAAARSPGSRSAKTGQHTRAAAMAEAALDVRLTAGAVATAAALTGDAAKRARRGRALAGRVADQLVAEEAAQNAAATRFRADAAAGRVREAAERAAASERRSAAPGDPATKQRADRMAVAVEAAALALAQETAALAHSVAQTVAMAAQQVAGTRLTLERAIAAEVTATATAVELRAMAAAHVTAADNDDRLRRPTTAR